MTIEQIKNPKKVTENSIFKSEQEKNVVSDTMNSNPATQRNSFINHVPAIYGEDIVHNLLIPDPQLGSNDQY